MRRVLVLAIASIIYLSLAGCAPSGTAQKPESKPESAQKQVELVLLSDFSKGQPLTSMGGSWFSVNDSGNGGDSVITPNPLTLTKSDKGGAKGGDYYAKVSGNVTTKYQYGFVALDLDFKADQSPVDISKYNGLKFFTRGDGKRYQFQIRSSENSDYNYYTYTFSTSSNWTEVTVPLSSFTQATWGRHTDKKTTFSKAFGIQYITLGQPIPSIEFEIDELYLY
jgi:hypothetical protein